MPSLNELDAEARTNTDRHINELIALCAQPSIAAQNVGMRECAELVSDMLRTRGFEIKLLPTRGYPVVFGERTGRSDRTLIFYNHYDVQPPEPL